MALDPSGENRCQYTSPDGRPCPHPPEADKSKCLFHLERSDDKKPIAAMFVSMVLDEMRNEDSFLHGFIYPIGIRFKDSSVDETIVLRKIDISFSDFVDADFLKVKFLKGVTAKAINTEGYFNLLNCQFMEDTIFNFSEFNGEVSIASTFYKKSHFIGCAFHKKAEFRGNFKGKTSFSRSVFYDTAVFRGRRSVTEKVASGAVVGFEQTVLPPSPDFPSKSLSTSSLANYFSTRISRAKCIWQHNISKFYAQSRSKLSTHSHKAWQHLVHYIKFECLQKASSTEDVVIEYLFHQEVNLQEVDYRRPDRVSFFHVDLTKAKVVGTDFTGVQFYDAHWYQKSLGRNGLFEEVELRTTEDHDYERFNRPRLEKAYRNIRVSLESQKEYDTASDFLIGEMNYKLLQKPCYKRIFSILGIYKILSVYGTNPARIIFPWFTLLLISHVSITAYLNGVSLVSPETSDFILRTLKLATLQKLSDTEGLSISQEYADLFLRFLSPILLALLALTIRARIKRF